MSNCDFLRLLYLDIPNVSKKVKNTAILISSTYIVNVWLSKSASVNSIKNFVKAKVIMNQRYIKEILGNSMCKYFTQKFCDLKYYDINV